VVTLILEILGVLLVALTVGLIDVRFVPAVFGGYLLYTTRTTE
jgi:hypothetical protein